MSRTLGVVHPVESTMANEISMSQKQTIAVLHAQSLSNRSIARMLALYRQTVGRQVWTVLRSITIAFQL